MREKLKDWRIIGIGLAGGSVYALIEWYLDQYALGGPPLLERIHDVSELTVPVILGMVIAFGFIFYRQLKEFNQRISSENTKLKSKLLTNSFASFILHEIRNPIHNLAAILEKVGGQIQKSDEEIIERNLARLKGTTDQLKHINILSEQIQVNQTTDFSSWLQSFVSSSVLQSMRKANIRYEQDVQPLRVKMHPILLEQCFTLLFDNAVSAAENGSRERFIRLEAALQKGGAFAEIFLRNTGFSFPEDVLTSQGRSMVQSIHGSGLGLVLVRDTLKQVHGLLTLENDPSGAKVTLLIPVEDSP